MLMAQFIRASVQCISHISRVQGPAPSKCLSNLSFVVFCLLCVCARQIS
ncbi:hypothetical protein QTP70_034356 [Hemibagrus guttatus]|uniref:Uncharacterized protein n=1 Tax=Hemibagrus guttatus TaxID=175788 RepID=A0AAE0R4W5_9TELE|nr:hypothetical protein QTP70_034356 [Hemibagrus guttatus]